MNFSTLKEIFTKLFLCSICILSFGYSQAQQLTEKVNVFLGSSGDHGQLSPAASSPFHQLSIAPQTYPNLHMGYEHYAKEILGFTHNRFEGVGCQGSGGLIFVKPYLTNPEEKLVKETEIAGPGFYEIGLRGNMQAKFAVDGNFGTHEYFFPKGKKGLLIDFEHSFNRAFVSNEYEISPDGIILGKIRSKTTCHVGVYTIYYAISIPNAELKKSGNRIEVILSENQEKAELKIAFSSVDKSYALATLTENSKLDYAQVKSKSTLIWENFLSHIVVKGDPERENLFYSLLYRTLQSPYQTSEPDGNYRGTDGQIHQTKGKRYHGWAIWDNYKTQLPLLELAYPSLYQDVASSISDLYKYGKYDFAGQNEPANSVRTEHAAVVLLDAKKKGYDIDFKSIRDSLIRDTARFDWAKPDKYLEAAYDMWAMGNLFPAGESENYFSKSKTYASIWNKEFKDLTRSDVDRMSARNMYQGTIRQYRWNVPFDMEGLRNLIGGKDALSEQLDEFFDKQYFNRANEPDIQSPVLYYASSKPWRYQSLVQELAVDTVIQYYFNDNSRGIGPHIDRIYKNEPKAFVRTMDDDAGAMSAWFIFTSIGLHQPLIGEPIYYLNVPLFEEITFQYEKKPLHIVVKNFDAQHRYIKSVKWNGKDLGRVWVKREELAKGGELIIEASPQPTDYGADSIWISSMK
ncbi:glycoside hydrolase domain-containing protein [Sphingobacterium hungaricum]